MDTSLSDAMGHPWPQHQPRLDSAVSYDDDSERTHVLELPLKLVGGHQILEFAVDIGRNLFGELIAKDVLAVGAEVRTELQASSDRSPLESCFQFDRRFGLLKIIMILGKCLNGGAVASSCPDEEKVAKDQEAVLLVHCVGGCGDACLKRQNSPPEILGVVSEGRLHVPRVGVGL